ncbi:MAG TPA: PilZ domain-containing protein [Pyrinomonadaceae bacterium]
MEFARSIASRLRQYAGDRRRAKRVKARLNFTISLVGPALSTNGAKRVISIKGHTLDLSSTGLALIVPTIIVNEHHLVGENRNMFVKLELPDGPLELNVVPIRYERLDDHPTETGYLIGVKLGEVDPGDRARFSQYVGQELGG